MNIRAFIGDRLTTEFTNLCDKVYVNPDSISEQLINDLKDSNEALVDQTEVERIRLLFHQFQERQFIKSHLAVIFGKSLSLISRTINNPSVGKVNGG